MVPMSPACTSATGCWDLPRGNLATLTGKRNLEVLCISFGDLRSLWKITHLSMIYYYLQNSLEMVIFPTLNQQKVNTETSRPAIVHCEVPIAEPLIFSGTFEEGAWSPSSRCTSNDPFAARLNSGISGFRGCQTGRNCMTDMDGCWQIVNVNDIIHLILIHYNIYIYIYIPMIHTWDITGSIY